MLLDRIDIDAHGPLHRVELGPLAEHLNVVFAPDGSGKTAISRFIRDALVDRTYPLGMFSSSTGRVVLSDRHGMVHCHREKDGTTSGRRRVEFESRGDFRGRYDLLENPWLRGISQSSDTVAAVASLELPEAIVDGVITDTSTGSVARVVSACVRSGLDSFASYQSLPLQEGTLYAERNGRSDLDEHGPYGRNRALRRELADVDAELSRLSSEEADYDSLIERRNRLTSQLSRPLATGRHDSEGRRHQLQQRSADLQHRSRELRSQQSELRRRLADVELDLASCDLGRYHANATNTSAVNPYGQQDYHLLCRDRDAIQQELDRVTASLDTCLSEAAEVGRTLRMFPANGRVRNVVGDKQSEQAALAAELRRIDDRLAVLSRIQWLRRQRAELLKQVRVTDYKVRTKSPLAEAASRWLVRLSGGRLHRIDWAGARFTGDLNSYHQDIHRATGVTINGRDETQCGLADRMLAATAVRMAAGDFLAKTGRHVPLVLEIPRDAFKAIERSYAYERSEHAYREQGDHLRSNHPIAAALRDYVQAGRQLLILTSSQELAGQLARVGARSFEIHTHRVVHPHRPMWRSHYQGETYVGPHPHTYATDDAADIQSTHRVHSPVRSSEVDVNRDLDVAWRESQSMGVFSQSGFSTDSVRSDPSPRTDWARDGVLHRDGFYFADTYTTDLQPTAERTETPRVDLASRNKVTPASPFYLSVDSPIDQAPSVDAVAAARLRGLKVTHITHLMERDPNRLSDALGLASVDAATIRRWQAECRLACRVPNLRGFDARVLVGCGVTTPGQLAAIHPTDLLHEVEEFLATERGQQVLLSGTSQELSRIMTWIATANSAASRVRIASRESQPDSEHRRVRRKESNDRDGAASRVVTYEVQQDDTTVLISRLAESCDSTCIGRVPSLMLPRLVRGWLNGCMVSVWKP